MRLLRWYGKEKIVNCPNCQCDKCTADREGSEEKNHRNKVIESWNWNASPYAAAKQLAQEIHAGKGGTYEDWARDIMAYFPEKDASEVLRNYPTFVKILQKSHV